MMPQVAAVAGRRVISGRNMRQPPPKVKAVLAYRRAMPFAGFRLG